MKKACDGDSSGVRAIEVAHPNELPELAPDFGSETLPEPLVGTRSSGDCRRAGALLERKRQCVDLRNHLVQPQGEPRDVDAGRCFQTLDIPREHLAKREKLRTIRARETRIGRLQGGQGGLHAAGELELLHRNGENLLHLGQHPFVAAARQLLVERLQCNLLVLGFDKLRLELGELGLGLAHRLLGLACRAPGITTVRIAVAQPPGHLFAQSGHLKARVVPLPRDHGDHDDERNSHGMGMGEPAQPRPDAVGSGDISALFFHGVAATVPFGRVSHFSKSGKRFCQSLVARAGDDHALDAGSVRFAHTRMWHEYGRCAQQRRSKPCHAPSSASRFSSPAALVTETASIPPSPQRSISGPTSARGNARR
jgi:hypothetical protein